MKKVNLGIVLAISFALVSCATVDKASLDSTTVDGAMMEVENMNTLLKQDHVDLMASKSYREGLERYAEAREDIAEGEDTEEIMGELAMAKAYFKKAKSEAMNKTTANRILTARMDAWKSGVMKSNELTESFKDVDELFRDETDNFTTSLNPEDFSKIQKMYLDLEVKGVQYTNLNWARNAVKSAKSKNADDLAPETFAKAKEDLNSAENKISQNPKLETYFVTSVNKANNSAGLLSAVMNKLTGSAKGSSEEVALTLVKQSDIMDAQSSMIAAQGSVLASAASKINFQEAMNRVRKNFSENEAEVYQQGDKLIIRLKDMKFKTGSSTVPTESIYLLRKLQGIVTDLGPTKVEILGHTDARGSNQLNEKLSSKRARSVAEYFASTGAAYDIETKGFGESKPIATNETAEGRALNRRVDLVIDVK